MFDALRFPETPKTIAIGLLSSQRLNAKPRASLQVPNVFVAFFVGRLQLLKLPSHLRDLRPLASYGKQRGNHHHGHHERAK